MAQAQVVEDVMSGLFSDAGKCVPLKGVSIAAQIHNAASKITVSQRYKNTEDVPVEAVYSFPLQESSSVCGFEVEIGDRKITGRVEEKEAAFEEYDEAMAAGHGAFLLDQNRPNIFTASVGNLLPGQEVIVHISYVSELEREGDQLRLLIPTTISPRYMPSKTERDMEPVELDSITPPTVVGGVSYGLRLVVDIATSEKISSVESPSHNIKVTNQDNGASIELVGDNVQLDQDFVLTVAFAERHKPMAMVSKDREEGYVAMVNFMPEIPQGQHSPQEVTFLLDRSGSMGGESIEQAKKALLLCLRSLREGDYFNIVGFGSVHQSLFPNVVAYQQENLDAATMHVQNLDADLGGTELLTPLEEIFRVEPQLPRQIILLTDGQVGNEPEICKLASRHSETTRIFSFGIGRGASEYLVKELARVTKGASEFIFPGERIEPKVLRQFERVGTPYLKNITVDWGDLKVKHSYPESIPAIFSGDIITVYGQLTEVSDSTIKLTAEGADGLLTWETVLDSKQPIADECIPVLMARSAIRELEEGKTGGQRRGSQQQVRVEKKIRQRIIDLGSKYQLISSETSFVAIEIREENEEGQRAKLRRIPIALTRGWGGYEQQIVHFDARIADTKMDCEILPHMMNNEAQKSDILPHMEESIQLNTLSSDIKKESLDRYMDLILLQRAHGCWELDSNLARICDRDLNQLIKVASDLEIDRAIAQEVIATLLVLHVLNNNYNDRIFEWKLPVKKAEEWLSNQAVTVPDGYDSLYDWIEYIMQNI